MVGAVQRLQAEHIGSSSVKGEEDFDAGSKMFFEFCDGRARVGVVTVRDDVALICTGERFENFGMDSSIVVAGKASRGSGGNLRHTNKCSRGEVQGLRAWIRLAGD